MALHPEFPTSPYAILDPAMRWFPADEALRESSMDKLLPPLAQNSIFVGGGAAAPHGRCSGIQEGIFGG